MPPRPLPPSHPPGEPPWLHSLSCPSSTSPCCPRRLRLSCRQPPYLSLDLLSGLIQPYLDVCFTVSLWTFLCAVLAEHLKPALCVRKLFFFYYRARSDGESISKHSLFVHWKEECLFCKWRQSSRLNSLITVYSIKDWRKTKVKKTDVWSLNSLLICAFAGKMQM